MRSLFLSALVALLGCAAQPTPRAATERADRTAISDPQALLREGAQRLAAGEYDVAVLSFELAADAAERLGEQRLATESLAAWARALAADRDIRRAREVLERAEAGLAEDAGPREVLRVLEARGLVEQIAGELAKASVAYRDAFALAEANDETGTALEMAHRLVRIAPPADATWWAERELALARGWDNPRALVRALGDLALVREEAGLYDESLDALWEARQLTYRSGAPFERLGADWAVGRGQRLSGDARHAREWATNVLSRAEELYAGEPTPRARSWVAIAAWELAECQKTLGHETEAQLYFDRAQELFDELDGGGTGFLDPSSWTLDPRGWWGHLTDLARGIF